MEYVIGVSLANLTDQWRLVLKNEIETQAEKYSNIRLIVTDAASSHDKQTADLNRLMQYDVDLLIVSPWEVEKLTPVISEVYQSVPVIVLDRIVNGYDYTLFIGPDNQLIGEQAARAVLEQPAARSGTVLELCIGNYASQERSNTFVKTLADFDVQVRQLLIEEGTRDCVEDELLRDPAVLDGVSVIFAHNDYMAYGAYLALEQLERSDIRIVGLDGFGGEQGGLSYVQNGQIDATIACPTGGREAVDYAVEILDEVSGVPKQIILRSCQVDKSNVDEYVSGLSKEAEARSEPIRVGHVQIAEESSWRKANIDSLCSAAHTFSIDLTVVETEPSLEKQIEQVRAFLAEGMEVIVISPIVEEGWDEVLREAKDAGVPVLLSDRKINGAEDLYAAFIGADFVEQGRRCAEWLLQECAETDGDVRILEIQGTLRASPTIERKKGFEEKIAEDPRCKIVYSRCGDYNREGGKQAVESYLQTYGEDINAIFAHNDDMALGAVEALREYGLRPGVDVWVMSIDGTAEAIKALQKGELNCVAECNPLFGMQLMKAITDMMSGKELPLRIITDEGVFTQQTNRTAFLNRKY